MTSLHVRLLDVYARQQMRNAGKEMSGKERIRMAHVQDIGEFLA